MDALQAIGDPARRRIVELLASSDLNAGELAVCMEQEFEISQPATSRHLKVLRESRLVSVQVKGQQRVYRLDRGTFAEIGDWITSVQTFWSQRLDALETELARGKAKARRETTQSGHSSRHLRRSS